MESERSLSFPEVKELHLPAQMTEIHIRNSLFPNLEKVQIASANPVFGTDGRIIFTKKSKKLCYCLVLKGASLKIPGTIREIEANAFQGTAYEEIIFTKENIRLDKAAFQDSRWLERQGDLVIIGTMLYHFSTGIKCLNVPDKIKTFHPDLFTYFNIPEKLVTPVLPGKHAMEVIAKGGKCSSLVITSSQTDIPVPLIRLCKSLQEVIITEQHRQYRTQDGVVYSKDGKVLVWYPSSKRNLEFTIPDSVQKISEYAFWGQLYLQKITMPDTVVSLGICAFLDCCELKEITLSRNIKQIPDANSYQKGGVFENCEKLKTIVLPENLEYLGSYAFCQSGLTSITINHRLEQIGEYSLMAENLHDIALPSSVRSLGKGSLFYATDVLAYEGTAKGMITAVNTIFPRRTNMYKNMKWSRCQITVLHQGSEKTDSFLLPASLKRNASYHLEIAWNAESIDYAEYALCLHEITDSKEKMEFAEQGLLRYEENGDEEIKNLYIDYLRQIAYRMGCYLLENGKEKEFLLFVKKDFLSEDALSRLLSCSNTRGMTICSAYIAERLNQQRKKKNRLRI